MSDERRHKSHLFSQIDVSQTGFAAGPPASGANAEIVGILRDILAAQDRQNELLEELVNQVSSTQRQRANELGQWKQANPQLAKRCRSAAEALSKIQTEYLASLTREIGDNYETLLDGEFKLNEFVDRFGPRLAHLNGLLQVLSQLSSAHTPAGTPNST